MNSCRFSYAIVGEQRQRALQSPNSWAILQTRGPRADGALTLCAHDAEAPVSTPQVAAILNSYSNSTVLSYMYTALSYTALSYTALSYTALSYIVHSYTVHSYTALSYTALSYHTQRSHTQRSHTQLSHTLLSHTQRTHTLRSHTLRSQTVRLSDSEAVSHCLHPKPQNHVCRWW